MTDLTHLRKDFPILQREVNEHPLVYLDSAATSQKPVQVLDAMDHYYRTSNSNVHRGAYVLAEEATHAYEAARAKVAGFIGADASEVAFVRGATSGINTVAFGWGLYNLREGDRIVLTTMEHHANVVPWQLVARHTGAQLAYLPITEDYLIDTDALDRVVDDRTRVVAFSGMSNVLGSIGPIDQVVAAARSVGAITVLDGAQMVPHIPTDVSELGLDALVFSAHKMLGPTGVGALWGRREFLESLEPSEGGGEMIRSVGLYESTWNDVPHRFEAGTPPIAEAIGFGAAVDYLTAIGMDEVRAHEVEITNYALEQLTAIPDLTIYGPMDPDVRGGAVSFTIADIHPHDIATILDQRGVAVRAGRHCAQPLMDFLGIPATARASFYVYNEPWEIDVLVEGLHEARRLFRVA